jgi:hypothetical protein
LYPGQIGILSFMYSLNAYTKGSVGT